MKEVLGDKVEKMLGSGYIMSELKKKAGVEKSGKNKEYGEGCESPHFTWEAGCDGELALLC
eukprot:8710245-Heterocapsa_arctica.AAC.1